MHTYRRVLLVEDDPLALLTFTLALQSEGLEVLGAGTGREAMRILRDAAAGVAAAVIDLDLRAGDGYALGRSARALKADLPVFYLAGAARPEFEGARVPDGELVVKPVSPQALARRVREAAARADLKPGG